MNYLDLADRTWPLLQRAAGLHTWLYRTTGGRLGQNVPGGPGKMLLLDHVGAKSGAKRTAPLLYVKDGENVAVIASKGGYHRHPAWFHNLMANPDTVIQIGRERRPVHARIATGDERGRLWAEALRAWSGYEDYAAHSKGREIPLVILERR